MVERAVANFLNRVGLSRIRSKIIVFALLATLIPSFSMGWVSYRNNRRILQEKITQELVNLTSHASKELAFWFKEREYEVRVFASSYEVSENLARLIERSIIGAAGDPASPRLATYLGSVGRKFPSYQELQVVNLSGELVATSRSAPGELLESKRWLERLAVGEAIIRPPYWDTGLEAPVIPIVQPIRDAENVVIGGLVAKLDFAAIGRILASLVRGEAEELYVITRHGEVLASSWPLPGEFRSNKLDVDATTNLFLGRRTLQQFENHRGIEVVGNLEATGELGWGVVAHKEREEAYARILRLRNVTLALIGGVLVLVGAAAYLIGLAIVRPLDRLTAGAAKITSGDLEVNLPVYSRGEVGYLTQVFNRMAARMRKTLGELDGTNKELLEKNEELHQLSITDSLTDLHNRKHMMDTLTMEVARATRYDKIFSILMIDIDDFKRYNDTHGHLDGDEVLRGLGAFLKGTLRTEDYAARYGGEEFLILLPETKLEGAATLADRLRKNLEEKQLGATSRSPGITVSIGVAAFPVNGDEPEELIRKADFAMYSAKQAGRNQVMSAKRKRKEQKKGPS